MPSSQDTLSNKDKAMRYETPLGSFETYAAAADALEACDMGHPELVNPVDDEAVARAKFALARAPATEPKPARFENNSGEQLSMFAKGSDWKPRHRDLFDVETL